MVHRPKYLSPSPDGQRWLISYTDVLTLLLVLFIAVAAQTVSKSEAKAIAAVPAAPAAPVASVVPPPVAAAASTSSNAAPAPEKPEPPIADPSGDARSRTEALLKAHGLEAKREERGLVISLPQSVLFASGDDQINASARPLISEIAAVLRDLNNKVELAGHADSIPIHTRRFKDNWELSAARGLSLLSALTKDYGIAESRLTVSSHGSFSPKISNDTADGRAENRRVEILILDEPK